MSNSFLFGYRAVAHSLRDLHPTPLVSQALWDAYEKNVAPLILILHKPTIRNLVRKAATNAEFLDAISEALVFAVYFAAVMSMKPAECRDQLGLERQIAIQHYRFAAGKALSRADSLHVRFFISPASCCSLSDCRVAMRPCPFRLGHDGLGV
jgi:hypothetical protein